MAIDHARCSDAREVRPGMLRAWVLAVRPRTLTIAVGPVLVGTAAGSAEAGRFDPAAMVVAMIAAVLIQAGTNLQNDVGDYLRGADGADRLGPPRVTSAGWLSAGQVERAAALAFGLAIALGGYLVRLGGWPVVVAGVASVAAGIAYTRGPRPIAYTALGEPFVFVFFGLVAVGATYYLQAGSLGWSAADAGAMIGLLAAAVRGEQLSRHRIGSACGTRWPPAWAEASPARSTLCCCSRRSRCSRRSCGWLTWVPRPPCR